MAGPADQAAANTQALNESLAAFQYAAAVPNPGAITLAAATIAGNDFTNGVVDNFVYDPTDATAWDAAFAANTASNAVFNARSGPMKAPDGGGWTEDQY